jgi:hypothetical protein
MSYDEVKYDEFAKEMETEYPKMFADPYGGFCVGAGWWQIIKSLCFCIQYYTDWKNSQFENHGRGAPVKQVTVQQIKEKFGGLRFYYSGGDDVVDGMIRMAESWASHSCEVCGKPGESRSGGWIRTLCDEHEAERQKSMKERFPNE